MPKKIKFNFTGTNPNELKVGNKLKVTSYWKDSTNNNNTWDEIRSHDFEVTIYEINKINEDCYVLKCIRHWEYINKDSKMKFRVNSLGQTANIYCNSQKGYCTKRVVKLI